MADVSPAQIAHFLLHIDASGGPDACHPWQGRINRDGYGVIGNALGAHRIACQLAHGAPPFDGAEAAHSCDNPPCCNGNHLSWKTRAANVAEQFERGRHRNFRPHGKPYVCGVCGAEGHNARVHRPRLSTAKLDYRSSRIALQAVAS